MDVVTRHDTSDAEIIEAARTAPDHFARVFDRHYGRIYAYAARRLGRDRAEDVASETFLVAFSRIAAYDTTRTDAAPWLYGIASNLIARHARAEARRYKALSRLTPESPEAPAPEPDLARALARLSRKDRDVLLLVAWAGLSQPEVAAALDIPAGTVRSRLHRARQEMRAALKVGDQW